MAKPHKNARIYTFCGVESRPGVCFRIRQYSKESQRKCSIQKESVITTYYRSQTTFEIKCSTPIGGAYKNFQSIGLLKQKLLLWVSRLTLTYYHWANRSSGRYPDLLPKPHKNARIYTFCGVESRPGVCFRIRHYSKESQRKCSIQKESVITTYYRSQTTFEIKCSTPIGGAYKNFQSIGLLKQKLLLWVSRLTLTYDHWANRSSGRYPDLLPKPHKNARIYTFCGVESRPGVCFRIRQYSKESQRKCSIQKESVITTYYRSQTTFEIKCSTPIGGAYKNFQSIGLLKQKLLLWVSRLTLTYDHWANRSSGRYPDLLPKPHKNARIYTFCGVESRPGVCFRIRQYSKESQRKCSIQKESVITTYYRSQTTFEIKCSRSGYLPDDRFAQWS